MIFELVRRDPATRLLPWGLLLAAVAGLWAGFQFASEGNGAGMSGAPVAPRILLVANLVLVLGLPMVVFGQVHRRALPFQLSLPLAPRQLCASRALTVCTLILLPALLGVAFYGATRGGLDTPGATFFLRFAVVLAVGPFLFQFRWTPGERADLPAPWLHWLRTVLLLIAAECWVAIAAPPLWITVLAAVAAAALLASLTWSALPPTFELAETLGRPPRRGMALPQELHWLRRIPVISPFAPLNCILRPAFLMWLNIFAVVAGVLNMVVMSVRLGNWFALFTFPFIQAIVVLFLIYGLPRVAHLPISRRRLFVQGVGQGFLLAALGLGLALSVARERPALSEVFGSSSVAMTASLWFAVWFLLVTAVLHCFLCYPPTRSGRLLSWLLRPLHAAAAVAPLVWADSLFEGGHGRTVATRLLIDDLGAAMPSPVVAWALTVAVAAGAYLGAEALFARIQVTRLRDKLVIQKR